MANRQPAESVASIVGCVNYKIPASGAVHHSGFIYELGMMDGNPPVAKGTLFRFGKDISVSDLVLIGYPFGGFDAN